MTSVVIPVYRNGDTLGTLHDRLHVILEGIRGGHMRSSS